MSVFAAGVDVGSTHTKALLIDGDENVVARGISPTGFRLDEAASRALDAACESAGVTRGEIGYVVSTGYGRHQVSFRDTQVTDLTAQGRAARMLFPGTRTVLDIGGQTMKALRIDEAGKVQSFRLNDKCAAGTGAFLEKTARYLGYEIEEIGPLAATAKRVVPISGVCAVFAESEVINHVSCGAAPAEILLGAMESLVDRAVQLLRRAKMAPEVTLMGGILRFPTMARLLGERIDDVNVPRGEAVQFGGALGAAVLSLKRLQQAAGAASA